jgi:transposase
MFMVGNRERLPSLVAILKDLVSGYLERSTLPDEVEPLKDIIGVLSRALLKLSDEVAALRAENALLRAENATLRAENAQLKAELAELRLSNDKLMAENAVLKADNGILQADVTLLKHKIFGSGKGKTKKKDFKDKTLSANSNDKKKHPGRQTPGKDLHRERVVYDIAASKKTCPHCQSFLTQIGEEISEQIEWVRASLKVLEHVRLKYACKSCSQTVVTAPTPYKPIEKGLAGPNLIAHVLVSKFCDHLPLYRLAQILKRYGISISRGTLCRWVQSTASLLKSLYVLLKQELILEDHLFADETLLTVLNVHEVFNEEQRPDQTSTDSPEAMDKPEDVPKAKKQKRRTKTSHLGRLWAYGRIGTHGRKPLVVYDFTLSRSGSHASEFLQGFKGYLQTDAYGGYNRLCQPENEGGQGCTPLGCWSHGYRKFEEALIANPNCTLSSEMLAKIGRLYDIEKYAKAHSLSAEAVKELRQERSKPILEEIYQWLVHHKPTVVPKGHLGRAISYMLNHWKSFTTYVEDGRLDIDNNYSERNIKLAVMGRKNYLFAGSEGGGESIAIIYSFIQTCLLNGVDPEAYLADVIIRIQHHPNSRAHELLPHNWKPPVAIQEPQGQAHEQSQAA